MTAWRKQEVDAARHRKEKGEATRLGKLISHTGALNLRSDTNWPSRRDERIMYGLETNRDLSSAPRYVGASRNPLLAISYFCSLLYAPCFIFILFPPYCTVRAAGGWGGALPDFLFLLYFPTTSGNGKSLGGWVLHGRVDAVLGVCAASGNGHRVN